MPELKYPDPDIINLPDGSLISVANSILMFLVYLLSALSILGFLIAGIMFVTSAGDQKKMETAKNFVTYSVVGVVVGLLSWSIVLIINSLLKGEGPI